MVAPQILAFDFDGVICDGLVEYFQTAWQAYCRLFSPISTTPPAGLAEQFYPLRPVVESGWEMPMVIQALLSGIEATEIWRDWGAIAHRLLATHELTAPQVAAIVDGVRDEWIQDDLEGWLALHRFYPGVIAALASLLQSEVAVVIISTKEGRFIQRLLQDQGIELDRDRIFGKEIQQPKYQTLRQVMQAQPQGDGRPRTWFIEDRLKTLQRVAQEADLAQVQLILADWGYNTEADHQQVLRDPRLHLLSLSQLVQKFDNWGIGA